MLLDNNQAPAARWDPPFLLLSLMIISPRTWTCCRTGSWEVKSSIMARLLGRMISALDIGAVGQPGSLDFDAPAALHSVDSIVTPRSQHDLETTLIVGRSVCHRHLHGLQQLDRGVAVHDKQVGERQHQRL